MRILPALAVLSLAGGNAAAAENGSFTGIPVVLQQHPGGDPKPFKLFQKIDYVDPYGTTWSVPAGSYTDGASIPWLAELITGDNYSGPYLAAAVVHDYFCCTQTREWGLTHRNFYYGMRADNTEAWLAWLMYLAVRLGGPTWDKLVPETDPVSAECLADSAMAVSRRLDAPVVADTATGPLAGFVRAAKTAEDERNRFVASKIVAVARTLKETNGQFLDVSSAGRIEASFDGVEKVVAGALPALTFAAYATGVPDIGSLGLLAPIDGDLDAFVKATAAQGGLAQVAAPWTATDLSAIGIATAALPDRLPDSYLADGAATAAFDKIGMSWASPKLDVGERVLWNDAINADRVIGDWQANTRQ